ncbi:hypothetical protein PsYK624_115590 [Phanerochaete sordida]|uniref:Uncharacterized protein n=1 Tax=Phanerochaete sordida TaxID=48140 RepID=A0A9P3GHY3_9APHY|nr:hypothetical protein PsYK624_115590 [Phanerochaete sordida]
MLHISHYVQGYDRTQSLLETCSGPSNPKLTGRLVQYEKSQAPTHKTGHTHTFIVLPYSYLGRLVLRQYRSTQCENDSGAHEKFAPSARLLQSNVIIVQVAVEDLSPSSANVMKISHDPIETGPLNIQEVGLRLPLSQVVVCLKKAYALTRHLETESWWSTAARATVDPE